MDYVKSMLGYGKMSPELKKAMMRLEKDRQELIASPVTNVSATPLESNMLEWHCNIQKDDNVYHLILFFPKDYPCISPSAEFVPQGFNYRGGATMNGKKGTKICLSIFSDFADHHKEWAGEKNTGWSPGYTVQTVLLNVVSFLAELETTEYGTDPYKKMCRKFVCHDCGHSFQKPFPPLDEIKEEQIKNEEKAEPIDKIDVEIDDTVKDIRNNHLETLASRIVDYVSKENFSLVKQESRDQMFGYGLAMSGNPRNPLLTSPCEFLTLASFKNMWSSLGEAQSVHREKLSYFLPLYLTDDHGSQIRDQFEETMQIIAPVLLSDSPSRSISDIILKVIPNLMCSTVVQFSKGTVHTSDNSLEGYFALHRLFLWAMDTYPELNGKVNKRLQDFAANRSSRNKTSCPDIGQWLMLLSVSGKYTWEDVAQAYLAENFNRNVMWYLKTDRKLANMDTPMDYRLQHTFELTKVGRNLLAFQVAFLRIAKPNGMSRGDILKRYADNLGFPTHDMVQELKEVFTRINNEVTRYDHWFKVIGVPVPSRAQLHEILVNSVKYANSTQGYHFTNNSNRKRRN